MNNNTCLKLAKELMNEKFDGVEMCPYCSCESGFTIIPAKGVDFKCEHCGKLITACSLCDSNIAECSEGNCTKWILRSLVTANSGE